MIRLLSLSLLAGGALLFALPVAAAPKKSKTPPAAVAPAPLVIDVVDYVLPNGLRVILSPDAPASVEPPTVGVAVYYDVGSRDEVTGQSGMVHLVEHLMFQGSKNLGPGEHLALIHAAGGEADGITHADRTGFFDEVPSHWLERTLWAEADRMAGLEITQEQLDETRGALLAERVAHQAQLNAPAAELLNRTAFTSFAYSHPAIGSEADLSSLTVDDIHRFMTARYGTSGAVLAVAGQFVEADARKWIDHWFGRIPRERPAATVPVEPTRTAERRAELRDPLAPSPTLYLAFRTPPPRSPEWYAVDLLAAVLGRGEGARFPGALAGPKGVAESVQAGIDLDILRADGLFDVELRLAPSHDFAEAERLVEAELEKVRQKGVTSDELVRAQRRARAALASSIATHGGRAQRLAEHALAWGDPRKLATESARYDGITVEQVRQAAQRLFVPAGRAVVEVSPAVGGGQR